MHRLEQAIRGLQHGLAQLRLRLEQVDEGPGRRPPDDEDVALPTPRPADIQAYLLGPFHVLAHRVPVGPWRSQKAASVLKFLLLHGNRPVRRDVLMEAFWPSSSAKAARNNLNVTMYQLRGILGEHDPSEGHVVYRDGAYRLDPALTVWVDVEEYSEQVVAGRRASDEGDTWGMLAAYERARELYRGPLLEGDTSGEWFLPLQERFQLEHCATLERTAEAHLELGVPQAALERAEEALRVDPCRESAHQLVMRVYAELAQPQLVARQYRRCQTLLRRELDVDPTPATTALYRRLIPTA